MVNIQVGNYEVLESGCVTSVGEQDVLFSLSPSMNVRLRFLAKEGMKQSVDARIEQSTKLLIELTNFNNPLGTELVEPLEIGTYKGRKLLLHIRVIGMSDSKNRVVFYTWFLAGNINNGR